jgi:hypothetical protein
MVSGKLVLYAQATDLVSNFNMSQGLLYREFILPAKISSPPIPTKP